MPRTATGKPPMHWLSSANMEAFQGWGEESWPIPAPVLLAPCATPTMPLCARLHFGAVLVQGWMGGLNSTPTACLCKRGAALSLPPPTPPVQRSEHLPPPHNNNRTATGGGGMGGVEQGGWRTVSRQGTLWRGTTTGQLCWILNSIPWPSGLVQAAAGCSNLHLLTSRLRSEDPHQPGWVYSGARGNNPLALQ